MHITYVEKNLLLTNDFQQQWSDSCHIPLTDFKVLLVKLYRGQALLISYARVPLNSWYNIH